MVALSQVRQFAGPTHCVLVAAFVGSGFVVLPPIQPLSESGCALAQEERDPAVGQDAPRVLILHSYHHGFTWSDNISRGIRSVFVEKAPHAELLFEFMDVKRVHTDEYFRGLCELLCRKYADQRIDVMICSDDHALDFLLGVGKDFLPNVPIVFCGINDYDPAMRTRGRDITGVVESIDIAATLDVAMRLHPETKRVAVITDMTRTGRALKQRADAVFRDYADRLQFDYLLEKGIPELRKRVSVLPKDSIVFVFIFSRDPEHRIYSHEYNLSLLAEDCPVPIYSVWEFYLGHGLFGGMLTSGKMHGRKAAALALRILEGEDADAIPVVTESPNRYGFDGRQLARFHVDLSDLPEESHVIHKPFDPYQEYRSIILGTTAAFAVLLVLVLLLIANIVSRRRFEEALRKSDERYRLAQRLAGIGVWEWDIINDVVYWSDEARTIFGRKLGACGSTFAEVLKLVHPDDLGRMQESVRQCMEEGKEHVIEHRIVLPDGRVRWVSVFGDAERNAAGNAVRMLGVIMDVSDRKQAELDRERLEAQLLQAQKMEAVGQLAGGVAHDFNNILTAILGNVELAMMELGKRFPSGSPITEEMRQIESSAQRASTLTRQLLAFSRREIAQPRDINLNDMLSDMQGLLRRLIEEDITLEVLPARDLPSVRVDPGHMEQVIMNLVVNARDAMPGGGRLTLKTDVISLDSAHAQAHAGSRVGPHVTLAVSDTGCGMDAETLEHVFEPFFTTKKPGAGTGLGLAMAYGLVRQADGHIVVHSRPGQGTTFQVYLPATRTTAESVHLSPSPEAPLSGAETILVCEDDDAVRELTVQVLREAGYNVLAAASGEEARAISESYVEPIDLLLADVILPDTNGRHLSEALTDARPGLRTLYVSGYTADVIAHHGVLDDGVEFLPKPFSRQGLLQRIRQVIDAKPV